MFARWWSMYGEAGVGLRGGTFTTTGLDDVRFGLDDLRWVENLAVSGRVRWDRATGEVAATVTCAGRPIAGSTITWNYNDASATATVSGRVDGVKVALSLPAP